MRGEDVCVLPNSSLSSQGAFLVTHTRTLGGGEERERARVCGVIGRVLKEEQLFFLFQSPLSHFHKSARRTAARTPLSLSLSPFLSPGAPPLGMEEGGGQRSGHRLLRVSSVVA